MGVQIDDVAHQPIGVNHGHSVLAHAGTHVLVQIQEHPHRGGVDYLISLHRAHRGATRPHVVAGKQTRNVAKIGQRGQAFAEQVLLPAHQVPRDMRAGQPRAHKQAEANVITGGTGRHEEGSD